MIRTAVEERREAEARRSRKVVVAGVPAELLSRHAPRKRGPRRVTNEMLAKGERPVGLTGNGSATPRTAASDETMIVDAYFAVHDGLSVDRFLVDPDLVAAFLKLCRKARLTGTDADWLHRLLGLRKAGRLPKRGPHRRVQVTQKQMDPYIFAGEIAWQRLRDEHAGISLDDILCIPSLAARFDRLAQQLAPGFTPVEYRWAALGIRKRLRDIRRGVVQLSRRLAARRLPVSKEWPKVDRDRLAGVPGIYVISDNAGGRRYVGETFDLTARLRRHDEAKSRLLPRQRVAIIPDISSHAERLALQSMFVGRLQPSLNLQALADPVNEGSY